MRSFLLKARALSLVIAFCGLSTTLWAQRNVTGTVTSATDGFTLPGVTVRVAGTSQGTTTDLNGKYSISVSGTESVLVFSYVGFVEQQVTVGSRSVIDVVLEENVKAVEEVVVIGYGTTTQKDATGALTQIGEDDFNQGNIVTPENLLNGRVAGLSVTTGGEPGSGSVIRVRGGASLGASNDPLIVINGLPIDNNSVGGSRSILSSINPNEIESFTVLKDASATAIYGSRASNGVIIITTKDAGTDFRLTLDTQVGYNTIANKVDVFGADEYRDLVNAQRPDLAERLGNANTDWQDAIYRNGWNNNVNLSAQGTLFKVGESFVLPGRISLGQSSQQGLRLTSQFDRYNGTINLNPTLLDGHLKININANGSVEENRFANGVEGAAIYFDPTQPVYSDTTIFGGYFQYWDINNDGTLDRNDLVPNAPFNPVAELLQRNNTSRVYRYFGNAKFDYNFHALPELTAVLNLGMDRQVGTGTNILSEENPASNPDGEFVGQESSYTSYQSNVLLDGYGVYTKNVGNLGIEGTAGYSYQRFEFGGTSTGDIRNPLSNGDTTMGTDLVLIGMFARANLSWQDQLLLTVAYRRDGTSRFSEQNRWGNFPAAALAWNINETLFPESSAVTQMKLRLGWGITGQQDIGRNNADLYLQRYNQGQPSAQYPFGSTFFPIIQPAFRNEDLKWEETTTWNLGLDFGFADNRVTGTVEAFHKNSRDLLAYAAIADGSNFSNAGFQNIGNFISQGIEFTLNTDILNTADGLNWNVNFNTTFIQTEIESLAQQNADQLVGGIGGGTGNTIQVHRVGHAPYAFFVYNQLYDENGDPIEGAYSDLNGDNIINSEDRYVFEQGAPIVTMGFLTNFSYKGFDASLNLRTALGNYIYNNVNSANAQYDRLQNQTVLGNLPRAVLESNFNTTETVILSDYWLENGSYLRLDNATVGYTLDNLLQDKLSVRIYAGGQNLFVWTNYSGLDPEVFNNGIDNTIYPRPRTYYAGLNVRF